MSEHTPGPWLRDPCDDPTTQVIAAGNEVVIYHHRHPRQRDDRVVANMALSSAAPDLLAACEAAQVVLGAITDRESYNPKCDCVTCTAIRKLSEAIAKAKGATDAPPHEYSDGHGSNETR